MLQLYSIEVLHIKDHEEQTKKITLNPPQIFFMTAWQYC